jgi:hypothetical protein
MASKHGVSDLLSAGPTFPWIECAPMPPRVRAVFLLLLLLCQSLTGLASVRMDEQRDVLAHALVHGQAMDHHHHVDASLHLDDSEAANEHQHVHDSLQVHAMPLAPWPYLTVVEPYATKGLSHAQRPPIFLEGPLRPPQACL